MESVKLDAPDGVTALLGWDPKLSEHDRKRLLVREILSAKLNVEPKDVRVEREAPQHFGFHTQLIAEVDGVVVPLTIRNASFRAATVVAIYEPELRVGLDLRDNRPDESELHTMRRHSHLFDEDNVPKLIEHWTRVQAVRDADGRGARIAGDHVKLDSDLKHGWIPDRKSRYTLTDLSHGGWIITLAHMRED